MNNDDLQLFLQNTYPRLAARLERRLGGVVPAEDVVQEAFIKAWTFLPKLPTYSQAELATPRLVHAYGR